MLASHRCEFLPFMSPSEVVLNKSTGRISHLMLARTEQDEETGEWKVDEEEVLKKRCDFVISAFGSHLAAADVKDAISPVVDMNRWGPVVDKVTLSLLQAKMSLYPRLVCLLIRFR